MANKNAKKALEQFKNEAANEVGVTLNQGYIAEITPDSTFESLGIDSLDIVEMIMDLESDLGVELDLEDQKITTFGELAEFIDSKVN